MFVDVLSVWGSYDVTFDLWGSWASPCQDLYVTNGPSNRGNTRLRADAALMNVQAQLGDTGLNLSHEAGSGSDAAASHHIYGVTTSTGSQQGQKYLTPM